MYDSPQTRERAWCEHQQVIEIAEKTGKVQITEDAEHHPHERCWTVAQALGDICCIHKCVVKAV